MATASFVPVKPRRRRASGGQEFAIDFGDPTSYQTESLPMSDESDR